MTESSKPRQFREFAGALMALKAKASQESLETIRGEVLTLLERHEALDGQREPEFHYALAAFADEVFLTLDWPHRTAWRSQVVEAQRFGSRAAGERVFAQVDALLQADAPGGAPMAAVYLMMLGLGFRGRYRGAAQDAQIELRRERLWIMLERHRPEWLAQGRRIAPQAYAHTVQEGALQRLASPARWWALAAAVAVLWLAGSTYAWLQLTEPVTAQIAAVERKLKGQPARLEGQLQ